MTVELPMQLACWSWLTVMSNSALNLKIESVDLTVWLIQPAGRGQFSISGNGDGMTAPGAAFVLVEA